MKVSAIIPAAGLGLRMKSSCPKPFMLLKERFVLLYTLDAICNHPLIDEVILVVNKRYISKAKSIIKDNNYKNIKLVSGGKSRSESVLNGLGRVSRKYKYVLIHDGARPLVTKKVITKCIKALSKDRSLNGSIAAICVKSTIKQVNTKGIVTSTPKRSRLYKIQTPQVFKKKDLVFAYKNVPFKDLGKYKDDSQILEEFKYKIKVVTSTDSNIKITTPSDLKMAKALMR